MSVLQSAVDRDEAFADAHDGQSALAAALRERLSRIARGGTESARERHRSRGKLLPRDRVERLLRPRLAVLSSPLAIKAVVRTAVRN